MSELYIPILSPSRSRFSVPLIPFPTGKTVTGQGLYVPTTQHTHVASSVRTAGPLGVLTSKTELIASSHPGSLNSWLPLPELPAGQTNDRSC